MTEIIETVRHLQQKLDSLFSSEEFDKINAVLQKLDQLPISIEVLQGTGIGKAVNTYRKHEGGVSEHARSLVKKWKALVQAAMDAEAEQQTNHETKLSTDEKRTPVNKPVQDKSEQNNSCKIKKTHDSEHSKNLTDKKHELTNSKTNSKPDRTKSLPKDSSHKEKGKTLKLKSKCGKIVPKNSQNVDNKLENKKKSSSLVDSQARSSKGSLANKESSSKVTKDKTRQSKVPTAMQESDESTDKITKKVKSPEKNVGLDYQNSGLSFDACLAGPSTADKLLKSPVRQNLKRKLEDQRNATNVSQKTNINERENSLRTKSNNVKKLSKLSIPSSKDTDNNKGKISNNVEKKGKQNIEQQDKNERTGSPSRKPERSKEKSKNVNSLKKEDINIVKSTVTDQKSSSAIKKIDIKSEKFIDAKIKNLDATKCSSPQQKSKKTTIESKIKDDKKSMKKVEKQQAEKPKEQKDKVNEDKKRVYSSDEESQEEISFENTGLSFGDCLFGDLPTPPPNNSKGKLKKKKTQLPQEQKKKAAKFSTKSEGRTKQKPKEEGKVSLASSSKTSKSNDDSNDKKRKSVSTPKETPSSKKIKNTYDSGILLPEISNDYKPLPRIGDDSSPRKRWNAQSAIDSSQIQFKGTKESRTKVFSGKARVHLTAVPTLFDACMRILCDNIDLLEDVGGVPFDILKPVMERCTYQQLYRLEEYNPHFVEDSDYLWQKHVEKEFKFAKPCLAETWKECYLRSFDEREQKFKLLTENITASYAKKDTGRKVMLAYVDRPAKAPRNVRRKQEQHGTAGPVTQQEAPHKRSSWVVPRNEDTSPNKPVRTTKIIAPMMQKTLRFIKKLQKR
ncbi:uncharacterized protein [Antedon mediterranea]|uniref:uncharacterized protein isoform X2 n=1 Tax=Antedon mediterranea TaxID=105859 RepID=UPI003AF5AE3D